LLEEHRARQPHVAAARDDQRRGADEEQQAQRRADHERRDGDDDDLDDRHGHFRPGLAQQLGHRAHVAGGAGGEVARAGPLHGAQRQAQYPVHERLAQPGGGALAEPVAEAAAGAHEDELREDAPGDRRADRVDPGGGPAGADAVDDLSEHDRQGRTRPRRRDVQGHDAGEGRLVLEDEALHGADRLGAAGDRQAGVGGAHRDSCREVRPRYSASRESSAWVPVAWTLPSRIQAIRSARVSHSGEAVTTAVVRPRRASATRSATRDSVWASTAEVGSTARSTSASAATALARRRRWRCPPERFRPPSAISPSRLAPRLEWTSSAQAVLRARTAASGSTRRVSPRRCANRWSSSSSSTRSRTVSSSSSASGTPPHSAWESR